MPGGRTPKPKAERRNRVKPVVPEVEIEAGAVPDVVPALPGSWSPEVVRWYEAWCRTPAAVTFSSTEWERLHRAAPLCQGYWLAVAVGDPREMRDAHRALLDAERGLPATDYERRRAGVQVKPKEPAAASKSAEVRRLKVV